MLARRFPVTLLAPATLVLVLGGVVIAPRVFAGIALNTINPIATIADNGHRIIVTGPVQCDQVQWVNQRVTVTQRTTGAVAEGFVHYLGTTQTQQWVVEAAVNGPNDFEKGPATVVAFAVTKVNGQPDDAHQWLVHVTLVAE